MLPALLLLQARGLVLNGSMSRPGLGKIANLHHGSGIASIGFRTRLAGPAMWICTSGPHDPRFEERHDGVCIAAVTGGTFRYRSSLGSAVLAPGALLLGNDCHCFECSHDHGVGDRCLSFRLAPEFLETVVSSVPGARRAFFSVPRLPPHEGLLPVIAAAEAARDDGDAGAFEELAPAHSRRRHPARSMRATTVRPRRVRATSGGSALCCATSKRGSMSRYRSRNWPHVVAMSPYHFLRTFRALVGNDAASIHPARADETGCGAAAAND